MTIIKALFAGVVTAGICIAQTNVTISGTVTDTGSVPISGASVRLEQGGLPTSSGADGSFRITGTIGIFKSQFNRPLLGKINAFLHNGYLNLNLREKLNIEITTYTIQGKALSSIHKTMEAGTYSVALSFVSAGVYFYRVQSGIDGFVLRSVSPICVPGGTVLSSQGTSSITSASRAMRYVPINDVIAVTKDGYLNYRVIVKKSDTSGIEIKMTVSAGFLTDADGNVYQTVKIGNQVWTAENLRTRRYNDGTPVALDTSTATWASDTTAKYCYYTNTSNTDSIKKFGALYNWYAVNTKKLTPVGWHIPSDAEWDTLANYLIAKGYNWDGTTTGNKIAKSLAARTDWETYTTTGAIGDDLTKNNKSAFSALPGGYRYNNGNFLYLGYYGYWWSTTGIDASSACNRFLRYEFDNLLKNYNNYKRCGFSARLVKD